MMLAGDNKEGVQCDTLPYLTSSLKNRAPNENGLDLLTLPTFGEWES